MNTKKGDIIMGRCMSCKMYAQLEDHSGVKLCPLCTQKFEDELLKDLDKVQFGKDYVLNERFKKRE